MADEYVHGIVINEATGEIRVIRSPSSSVIGFVGTASAPSTTLKPEVPAVFLRKKEALNAILPEGSKGDPGTLYNAVIGAYEQSDATVVLVRAKSGSDDDIKSAIEKLLDAESLIGFKPKILAAPGFGNTNPKETPPPAPAAALIPTTSLRVTRLEKSISQVSESSEKSPADFMPQSLRAA